MSVARLVLGTSTFAAGRLRPGKDSQPGIDALAAAIARGLHAVHSNPSLGTQWAVREAEDAAGCRGLVHHIIKVQIPLDLSDGETDARVENALTMSLANLGIEVAETAVIEADLKRTADLAQLVDGNRLREVYSRAARRAVALGLARRSMAYCHSAAQLLACMRIEELAGYAAQYNLIEAWPGLFLDHVAAQERDFLAMAPLGRGRLAASPHNPGSPPLPALRWVLGHGGVTAAVLTLSSQRHLEEALQAAGEPLPEAVVRRELDLWKRGERLTPG